MSEKVLEEFTRQYIQAQPEFLQEINFTWQGGEPTLLGLDFFNKAVEFQKKYKPENIEISNSFQTNGVLINDEWAEFFKNNDFLLGISIDGPEELHNFYRRNKKGKGSFPDTLKGMGILIKHQVEFNTLTCVQKNNVTYPVEIYDFLKQAGSRYFQFVPIVEKGKDGKVSENSVQPGLYGKFLNSIFNHWLENEDVGEVFIQDFDVTLNLVMGYPSPVCLKADKCGRAVVLEHNGDLYSCDHFVDQQHFLGNIMVMEINNLVDGVKQTAFGNDKKDKLPPECKNCEFLSLCNGGCPKDRLLPDTAGGHDLNYLCKDYKMFYTHTYEIFNDMATCLRMQHPASSYKNVKNLIW